MTFWNTWTQHPPFHEIENELQVAANFRKGLRPQRPSKAPDGLSADVEAGLWALIEDMWAQEPLARPSSEVVQNRLESLLHLWLPPGPLAECYTAATW